MSRPNPPPHRGGCVAGAPRRIAGARLLLCPCWTPEQAESHGGAGASARPVFRILAEPLLRAVWGHWFCPSSAEKTKGRQHRCGESGAGRCGNKEMSSHRVLVRSAVNEVKVAEKGVSTHCHEASRAIDVDSCAAALHLNPLRAKAASVCARVALDPCRIAGFTQSLLQEPWRRNRCRHDSPKRKCTSCQN